MRDATRNLLILAAMVGVFLLLYFMPIEGTVVETGWPAPIYEALMMLQDYARHHVLLCLVPALFIAGAITVFISQAAVLKYFGARANKILSYSVASVSGGILAVCSCTILPLFAGIYGRGAGIGPATTFLYSGPAINILALILTARVLGWELGVARAAGAVIFSVIIGLAMHFIYRKEEAQKQEDADFALPDEDEARPLWQTAIYFLSLVGILVFANWIKPTQASGLWHAIWAIKWHLTAASLLLLAVVVFLWFSRSDLKEWTSSTWDFAKQILPLLFIGVVVAGVLLGRPGHPALIPESWVASCVGGNSLGANLFASVAGALMYFATLTEVPILQSLMGAGMGKGPALALLLAGPALSLPNMLVIRSVLGTQKTLVYVTLVILLSASAGMIYGAIAT